MIIRLISPGLTGVYAQSKDFPQQKMTLTYLAALTPSEFDVEIVDEDNKGFGITYDKKTDIVAITFTTPTFLRAYEIADNYRKIGVPVIMGGFHVSLFPDEAICHADAIVIGEAEHVWTTLLSDFKKGKLKRVYKSDTPSDLTKLPIPRYEFYDPADFFNILPIFITRGCPYNCGYCCIKAVYGPTFRKRPIEDVIDQIQFMKKQYIEECQFPPLSFEFVDDNIWGDVKYAKELFRCLVPLNITWSTQASITSDNELLDLAAQCGCTYALIGFESLNSQNLHYLNKKQNNPELYGEFIEKMHQSGMAAGAFFMLGLPHDDQHCFDDLLKFLENNYIEFPIITTYIPIPGTPLFNEEHFEGIQKGNVDIEQILPVFTPKNMSRKEFKQRHLHFLRTLFSNESIEKRLDNCQNPMFEAINQGMKMIYSSPDWDEWADK